MSFIVSLKESDGRSKVHMKRFAAAAIAIAAFTGASPAFAGELSAGTDGAYGWTTATRTKAHVKDEAKDGHPVKIEYGHPVLSKNTNTLWEKRGYGNSSSTGTVSEIWRVQACEYINDWPDDCSGWDSD
ncbi:hypothetical protein ACIPW9_24305 [Streptomyces sp. NPDC090052]|uniref:hypothetical protein n=1 Tax=Streptomyces sp. NPDC090052 TaxID=3365931 RepID=UPI00382FD598